MSEDGMNNNDDDSLFNIRFRKNKRKLFVGSILRGVLFVLIAAFTGGATAEYVIYKSDLNKTYNYDNNKVTIPQNVQTTPSYSLNLPKNFINKVAENVSPAVVGINNKGEGFWGESNLQGSGSGIIFSQDGYIVTNYHVIKDATSITVQLSNGTKPIEAKRIGYDQKSDLAVIKVDAKNLPTVKFGDSSKVNVGDVAVAIGNPLGDNFAGTVTAGIISAVNRKIRLKDSETGEITTYKVLQTDAAINPGNSGGPLCNEAGEVIGINSLKFGGTDTKIEGMGFAISINEASNVINTILKYGHVSTPYLGIYGSTLNTEDKKVKGVYVQDIIKESGADIAGIKPMDIIIELDNIPINDFDGLSDVIEKHKVGDKISCKILRGNKPLELNIVLTEKKVKE